jgi:hypothetical protein
VGERLGRVSLPPPALAQALQDAAGIRHAGRDRGRPARRGRRLSRDRVRQSAARENVVRWLLHKPGFHKGTIGFGPNDRFFFAQPAFNDPKLNPDESNLLKMVVLRDDMYRQTNFGPRRGTCYFLRKGKGRPIVHDLTDSQCVDGLSHEQLVEVFNRVEMCISYDPYTVYSYYAALCGCVSVIVPLEGISKEEWYPGPVRPVRRRLRLRRRRACQADDARPARLSARPAIAGEPDGAALHRPVPTLLPDRRQGSGPGRPPSDRFVGAGGAATGTRRRARSRPRGSCAS